MPAPFDLLEGFTAEQAALLRSRFTPMSVAAGGLFIRVGEPGDCLYLVRAGEVEVAAPPPVAGGGRKLLARLGPGHVIGEMALLNREARNADVSAVTDCKLDRLSAEDYNALCGQLPVLKLVLTRLVAHRLSWSGSDVIERRIGSYTVIEPIGEGGMAWVYRAERHDARPDRSDGRVVALKMLPHALVTRPGFLEQFRQEAAVMTGLRHENIVTLYETIEIYGTMFLVLEYVRGSCLRDQVDRRGKFPPDEVWNIACSITQALRVAHARGVIHRDVKPDNIMVREDGVMKLMDFGIAVPVSGPTVDLGGVAISPRYGAPEIFTGERGTPAADFYNLGIMLYELLAGRLPFTADTYEEWATAHQTATPLPLRMFCSDGRPDLEALINATLIKDPIQRWAAVAPLLDRMSAKTGILSLGGQSLPGRATGNGLAASAKPSNDGNISPPPSSGKPPAMMALWIQFPGEPKERVFLMTKPLVLGREAPADIVIADASLSRRHLELSVSAGGLHARDLGSSNGSHFNGQQVAETDLHQNDRLRIGCSVLTFERESATGIHLTVAAAHD